MPALNKQTLINLLIDSPLREPIKINLIDIVNNTADADLPKTYSTIAKELEIFQKATERRMKLAEETISKLQSEGGAEPSAMPATPTPTPAPSASPVANDLPPMPNPSPMTMDDDNDGGLVAPKLDLPPLPKMNMSDDATQEAVNPAPAPSMDQAETPAPAATMPEVAPSPSPAPVADSSDEDALKEIQKELDALKSSATEDAAPAPAPAPQA